MKNSFILSEVLHFNYNKWGYQVDYRFVLFYYNQSTALLYAFFKYFILILVNMGVKYLHHKRDCTKLFILYNPFLFLCINLLKVLLLLRCVLRKFYDIRTYLFLPESVCR